MAEKLGEAILELRTDDTQLNRGIKEAESKSAALADRFDAFGKRAAKTGGKLSLAITAPLTVFGKKAIDAAREQEKAVASVDAALASMGDRAGFTSQELQAMASEMQRNSLFGDEAILQKVTANLLTFGNVTGDVFARAQQSALDLSARLGTDLQGSTVMLGKALNDPVKGITALTRVGVSFTEQQKEQIKAMAEAGDLAGAQAMILAELERQYGGQAKAAAEADGGITQLSNSFGDLQEQVGKTLIEMGQPLIGMLGDLVGWLQSLDDDTRRWVVGIALLAAALGPILVTVGLMASGIAALIPIVTGLGTAMMFIAANPAILALAAVLGAIFLAWMYWDDITAVLDNVGGAVTGFWRDNVQPALDAVMGKIGEVIDIFARIFGPEIKAVIAMVSALLRGDFSAAWDFAKEAVRLSIQSKLQLIEGLATGAITAMRRLFEGVKLWLVDKFNGLVEMFMGPIRKIEGGFAWLYDRVVGNSWVPDMMNAIAREAARFGPEFVDPLLAGARDVDAAFAGITGPSLSPAGAPGVPGRDDGPALPRERMADDFRRSFSDGIQAALRGDLGSFLERSFSQIADNAFRGVIDDLVSALFSGNNGGGAGGILSAFAGLFATGGTIPSGSWGIVGERGPEIAVATPGGLGIMSNSSSRALLQSEPSGGGSTNVSIPITIDATGADPAAIERLRRQLDQLRDELPGKIISTVQDASDRRMISMGGGM